MIDRIFGALLTFCVLVGGTVAVGSAMFEHDRQVAAIQPSAAVQLPRVEITARRATLAAAAETVEPTARHLQ